MLGYGEGQRDHSEVLGLYCRDCIRYEKETEKCRDGKVNPQRYEQALAVSQVMGLRALCVFNDHRERLVAVRGQGLGVRG